jgi:hypothetical protein
MADTRDKGLAEKEAGLKAEIERLLPDFATTVRDEADVVIIHQDSFAADYQDEEYALLGKAMKFAGIYGKEIVSSGRIERRSPRRKPHSYSDYSLSFAAIFFFAIRLHVLFLGVRLLVTDSAYFASLLHYE